MRDECLICHAPLEYLENEELMECAICHRQEYSRTRCVNGHYVCNECHMQGLDQVVEICYHLNSSDPLEILEAMMALPQIHMHGPEHHILVGAALLTAYYHAGGDIDLQTAIPEIFSRGKQVPGGACGFWGACGSAISTGMFISIITHATPLSERSYQQANAMTSHALSAIAKVGGPRCCKRNAYLSILTAVHYVKEHLGVYMQVHPVTCRRQAQNHQCLLTRCPFYREDEP